MKDLINKITPVLQKLSKDFSAEKTEKSGQAFLRFSDYLTRLENRYLELIKTEKDMNPPSENRSSEKQLELVDKTEAFHQHIYACLGAFIMLLSHFEKHSIVTQIPISSVIKFLNHLAEKNKYSSGMQDQTHILKKSVDFRSIYIDHPQQHAISDWMTYAYNDLNVIIYFARKDNQVIYNMTVPDPYSPHFTPPVNTSNFYVSPDPHKTLEAFKYIVESRLKLI